MDELSLDRPFVCGWSDGGQIALEIGIRYSNRVKALVLGAVVHEPTETFVRSIPAFGMPGPGEVDVGKIKTALPDWLEIVQSIHQQSIDHWITLLHQILSLWYTKFDYPA